MSKKELLLVAAGVLTAMMPLCFMLMAPLDDDEDDETYSFQDEQAHAAQRMVEGLVAACALLLEGRRGWWVRPRIDAWSWRWVYQAPDPDEWHYHFGMPRALARKLTREIKHHMRTQDTRYRKAIPAWLKVCVTLYTMRTGSTLRQVSQKFGLGRSNIARYIKQVCKAIIVEMGEAQIHLPRTTQQCLKVMKSFHALSGLPNVIGAVDGVHVLVEKPPGTLREYVDRKCSYSVVCQAMVDANGLFTDVRCAYPGSCSDWRIMRESTLYAKGENNQLGCGLSGSCYIIGDAGYALRRWLLTPFTARGGAVTREEKRFNYRLSRTRIVVEHAFGGLKKRFSCLRRILTVRKDVNEFIMACFVLHNFCVVEGNPDIGAWKGEGRDVEEDERSSSSDDEGEEEVDDRPGAESHYVNLPAELQARHAVWLAGRQRAPRAAALPEGGSFLREAVMSLLPP